MLGAAKPGFGGDAVHLRAPAGLAHVVKVMWPSRADRARRHPAGHQVGLGSRPPSHRRRGQRSADRQLAGLGHSQSDALAPVGALSETLWYFYLMFVCGWAGGERYGEPPPGPQRGN
jgi:hypothetical protein